MIAASLGLVLGVLVACAPPQPASRAAAASMAAPRPAAVPAGDVVHGPIGAKLDAFLAGLSREGFAGAVLVARGGEIWLKKGYGLADRAAAVANDSETLFEIGGLAKIFTAAAVLELETEGRLSVGDPVERWVGDLPGSGATLHHLLIHTSGLLEREDGLDLHSREGFLESLRHAPGGPGPGTEFRYSNAGYTLLAAVVERVTGMPFERFLATRLFAPAGMKSTAYGWQAGDADRATGYEGQTAREQVPVPPPGDVWGDRGPGGIVTNVGDLYRWILALESGAILPDESLDKMFRAYVGHEGYGWHVIDESNLGRLVRRGGALPAFEASVRWYRDDGLVIIFAINSNIGYRIHVAKGIARVLAPHVEPR